MNSKGIKAIPRDKIGHICMKCLSETDEIHKIVIPEMGYGSQFDEEGTEIHLCNKCYQESNPEIWSMEEIHDEYSEEFVYEKEMLEYIKTLPLESKELVWNHLNHGFNCFGSYFKMDAQDWIDYQLDELKHDKCKEYDLFSPEEIQAYEERFPTCEYPYNIIYDDGSKGCCCSLKSCYGEYGQSIDECNTWDECYECEHYKKRETPIRDILESDENDYELYMSSKINYDRLKDKFEKQKNDINNESKFIEACLYDKEVIERLSKVINGHPIDFDNILDIIETAIPFIDLGTSDLVKNILNKAKKDCKIN